MFSFFAVVHNILKCSSNSGENSSSNIYYESLRKKRIEWKSRIKTRLFFSSSYIDDWEGFTCSQKTPITTLIFSNLQQKYSVLPLADLNSCRLKYFNLEDKSIANLAISKRSVISEIIIHDVQEQHLQFPHNSIPYCSTCFSPLNNYYLSMLPIFISYYPWNFF